MSLALTLAIPILLVLTLTLLEVIHLIPFLSAILKLIGFAYTLWFIYHYLINAENRRKLLEQGEARRKKQPLNQEQGIS